MRAQHSLELDRGTGQAAIGHGIGVKERQRIIRERDARHLGFGERQLLGRERGKPRVVRARA